MVNLAVTEETKLEKTSLRATMRGRRAVVSPTEAKRAGASAVALLLALLRDEVRTAALHASLAGEVDTRPLDDELRRRGIAIAYPRALDPPRLTLHLARP